MTENDATAALLVVDDNEDNRYTLTRRLKREGYTNLSTANNGREALELLQRRRFDLVLLDIMMPDLDGYQVLEHLKGDVALRDIPVIMISALEEVESVIRCVELGAEDYLAKPFNPTLLRARVGASLEKKRLRDEVRATLARLERELEGARSLQLGMLPGSFPEWSPERPLRVHALMDPAREVGGDLYDAFYAPDGTFCFLVGDVSGKGAAAGMFMARTRSLARMSVVELRPRLTKEESSPAYIAEVVNRELCQNNRERMFVTLFLGFLDARSGVLTYINAGHPLPYLLRATGAFERIDGKPEAPLAVRPATRYRNRTVTLEPGDALFVFTDGVVEATNADGEHYSAGRLEAQLRAAADALPESMANAVKVNVDAFTGGAPKADDVTILALRRQLAPGLTSALLAAMPNKNGNVDATSACRTTTTDLVIRNEIAQLAIVSEAMERIGRDHALAPKALVQLQVALDEMVSNVIKYAWPEGGAHEIRIRITVTNGEVKIDISDDGRSFDPRSAELSARPPPGRRPRPGGVGLHMVKQMMDDLEYARIDGWNHSILTKQCDAQSK